MTAVQATVQGAETVDVQALAQRRLPRGPARLGGRFPIQLEEAGASGPDRARAERGRRTGSSELGGTDSETVEPANQAAPMGLATGPAPSDQQLPETRHPGAGTGTGEHTETSVMRPGKAAGTPDSAGQSRPAATVEMAGRSKDQGQASAELSGPSGRSAAAAAQVPAGEPVRHAGLSMPATDSLPDPTAPEAAAQRSAGAPAPRQATRTEVSALSSPTTAAFRLEPAGRTAGSAPSAQAERAQAPAPEPPQPADVLIGPGTGGLEVTIAAATPDLRDRFRAASADLQSDLSAIGAEVDAIRVELRADLADGGSGDRADGHDGSRGDLGSDRPDGAAFGPAETGGGEPDAAARLDLFDPGTGPSPDKADLADKADAAEDAGPGDTADAHADREAGRGAGDRAREIERLRLLPGVATAGSTAIGGATNQFRPVRAEGLQRIDRYA